MFLSLVCGCSAENADSNISRKEGRIIYGSDDRTASLDANIPGAQALTLASVAFVPSGSVETIDAEHVRLNGPTLEEALDVCPDEPFAQEPVVSTCSGTLVASDLILTAGHCVSPTGCGDARIVFGYAQYDEGQVPILPRANVAECVEVVARANQGGVDFALVRIDAAPSEAVPVQVRVGDRSLALGQRLFVIGHPTGLPQKVADNAWISANRADTLDFFEANLDAFPGNSGGGVFDETTGELVGILARGPGGGYVRNPGETCFRAQRVADGHAMAIESTYVARATEVLCETVSDPMLCACGNGTCEGELREDTASCPDDCGASCGDGACNGGESASNCYEDCGSCGNAVCEPFEVGRLSCCEDCGCPGGYECAASACTARLGNVNQDDRLDERDVALLSDAWRRARLPSQADVDCSGSIDELDRAALQARVAGESTLLPCEAPTDVAIGLRHVCVLARGRVRCFGDNSMGQLGSGDRPSGASAAHSVDVILPGVAVALSSGSLHTCALLEQGSIACWGDNQLGQLGGNPSKRGAPVPVPLDGVATAVEAGAGHTCALMDDGSVRCFGDDQFGQLGRGAERTGAEVFASPAVLPGAASAIAVGASHSCALMEDDSVRCWGLNQFGQLGLGNSENLGDDELLDTAPAVDVGGGVDRIVAHWMQTCALRHDGAVVCWGDNTFSQLGIASPARIGDDEVPSVAGVVNLGAAVSEVALGQLHSCARFEDGTVRCWGFGPSGALGYGETAAPPFPSGPPLPGGPPSSPTFVPPGDLPPIGLGASALRIFAGAQNTCVQSTTEELSCFGANFAGQLGYAFRDNVGDDETPESVGPVPLGAEPDLGWTFVQEPTLDTRLRVRSTRRGSRVTLTLRDSALGEQDLLAVYPFSTVEMRDGEIRFVDRSRHPGGVRLAFQGHPNRYALEFSYGAAGTSCGGKRAIPLRADVGFARGSSGWDTDNDYGASGLVVGRRTSTPRVQVLGADGTLYQGWWRPSDPEN